VGADPRILAFAGSTRRGSYNKKLIRIAARGAERAGAAVTLVDLADFPMPLYDGDVEAEQGLPEQAIRLRTLFKASDGLLISAPEYNSSLSAVLKNSIDWVSRPHAGEPSLACFRNKSAGLVAASPGRLGGLRCLAHLRQILGNIGVLVIPGQQAVSGAGAAFSEDGELADAELAAKVEAVGAKLADVLTKLSG